MFSLEYACMGYEIKSFKTHDVKSEKKRIYNAKTYIIQIKKNAAAEWVSEREKIFIWIQIDAQKFIKST